MGIVKLDKVATQIFNEPGLGSKRAFSLDEILSLFRAALAPDDPPDDLNCCAACGCNSEGDVFEKCEGGCGWYCDDCIQHDSEGVPLCPDCYAKLIAPEAGPRLMKANAHFNMIEKHSMDQHVEDRDCEVLKCQPVYAPVEAKACEHEWLIMADVSKIGDAYGRICAKCFKPEWINPPPDRPAPPSAEKIEGYELLIEDGKPVYRDPKFGEWFIGKLGNRYTVATIRDFPWIENDDAYGPRYILRKLPAKWFPTVGDWMVYDDGDKPGKLGQVTVSGNWCVAAYDGGTYGWEFGEDGYRPATDAEKFRPGAKVRCKMDDLEIIGIVERVDERLNIKFRYLTDAKHVSYCELLSPAKE